MAGSVLLALDARETPISRLRIPQRGNLACCAQALKHFFIVFPFPAD